MDKLINIENWLRINKLKYLDETSIYYNDKVTMKPEYHYNKEKEFYYEYKYNGDIIFLTEYQLINFIKELKQLNKIDNSHIKRVKELLKEKKIEDCLNKSIKLFKENTKTKIKEHSNTFIEINNKNIKILVDFEFGIINTILGDTKEVIDEFEIYKNIKHISQMFCRLNEIIEKHILNA